VVFTSPLGSLNKVDKRGFCFFPTTSFETTVGVDEKKRAREDIKHGLKTVLDFLFAWNTG
jgi:hypothetical protein